MSRTAVEITADIMLNPGMIIMFGAMGYMLYTVVRAGTAGARDRAHVALSPETAVISVVATFAGIRGLPPVVAIASNSARPLFAISPRGIEYRVMRKHNKTFAEIESVDLQKIWKTVNIEFRFRDQMLTLSVNAGTEQVARTILRAMPPGVHNAPQAAAHLS